MLVECFERGEDRSAASQWGPCRRAIDGRHGCGHAVDISMRIAVSPATLSVIQGGRSPARVREVGKGAMRVEIAAEEAPHLAQ